jgi:hypothetical protein
MKTKPLGIIETVKKDVVAVLNGTSKSSTPIIDIVGIVARDVFHRAVKDGIDLGHTANGFMLGVLYGTREAGRDVLDTIRQTAEVAMVEAAGAGGNIEAAALGLLAGAIHGAKEFGIEVQGASSAATDGVLKAADQSKSSTTSVTHKAPSVGEGLVKKPDLAASKK